MELLAAALGIDVEFLAKYGDVPNMVSYNKALPAVVAALAAQPSPGGQDALKALDDLAAFCSDDTATVDRHVAVIGASAAARQPVGAVPCIDYEDLVDQAKDLIHCGCSVNGAFDWLLEQLTDGEALAAPPAQAVDLGKFHEAVEMAMEAPLNSTQRTRLERLLALIDSQK